MAWFVWQDAEGQRHAEPWGGPFPHAETAPEAGTPAVCRCGQVVRVGTVWGGTPLEIDPTCVARGLPATACTCDVETT